MKKVTTYCDVHPSVITEESPIRIVLDDKVGEFDPCPACRKELDALMAPFFEVSRRPEAAPEKAPKTRAKKQKVPCEFCGKMAVPGSGMALHMKSSHPAEWADMIEKRQMTEEAAHA